MPFVGVRHSDCSLLIERSAGYAGTLEMVFPMIVAIRAERHSRCHVACRKFASGSNGPCQWKNCCVSRRGVWQGRAVVRGDDWSEP